MPLPTDKEKVFFIIENKDKMSQTEIAKKLDMKLTTVNNIANGKRCVTTGDIFFNVDDFAKSVRC